jgi:tetratricopeptide (TPR) repeat protein
LLLFRLEDSSESAAAHHRSIALRLELGAEFPNDVNDLRLLARCQRDLGNMLFKIEKYAEAEAVRRAEVLSRTQLLERFPKDPAYRAGLAKALYDLASVMRKQDKIEEARRVYAQAAEHQLELHQAAPSDRSTADALWNAYYGLAEAVLRQRDHMAMADVASRMSLVRPDVAEDALWAARFFARCVEAAGEDTELPEADRRELMESYGDRAVEQLHEAVRRGFVDSGRLQAISAFAPVRGRSDFQALVKDLEQR